MERIALIATTLVALAALTALGALAWPDSGIIQIKPTLWSSSDVVLPYEGTVNSPRRTSDGFPIYYRREVQNVVLDFSHRRVVFEGEFYPMQPGSNATELKFGIPGRGGHVTSWGGLRGAKRP
jgi:hypothetical protein